MPKLLDRTDGAVATNSTTSDIMSLDDAENKTLHDSSFTTPEVSSTSSFTETHATGSISFSRGGKDARRSSTKDSRPGSLSLTNDTMDAKQLEQDVLMAVSKNPKLEKEIKRRAGLLQRAACTAWAGATISSAAKVVPIEGEPPRRSSAVGSSAHTFGATRRDSLSVSSENEALLARMSLFDQIAEKKALAAEMKNFRVDTFLDIFDISFKSTAFSFFYVEESAEQSVFVIPYVASIAVCATLLFIVLATRYAQVKEMTFVVNNGYSKRWRTQARITADGHGKDPRVERDAQQRQEVQWKLKTAQAFVSDLPWIFINVARAMSYRVSLLSLVGVAVAGFGFGLKFSQVLNLYRRYFITKDTSKSKAMYKRVIAEVKIATGVSSDRESVNAIEAAYKEMMGKMGDRSCSLLLVFMTSNHDHAAALTKLRELAPNVPYSGCTTCMGVMQGRRSIRENATTVAIWAISDPEGMYTPGVCRLDGSKDISATVEAQMKESLVTLQAFARSHSGHSVFQGKPSFAWINSPPGPEDKVFAAMSSALPGVDLIGGSAADNSVAGEWRQWSSATPDTIHSNSVVYVLAHCSAHVQGALQTGYTPSPSIGTVTETHGPRHIKSIDNRPAALVYNDWCNKHFRDMMDAEETNILGPSSIYPLGQVCGADWDNDPVYRSMHPHLIVKKDKSLTLFSDVAVGEKICLMSGTPENLINRVGAVAATVVRESGIQTSELRGALVCFCAGVMLYIGEDMSKAATKLDSALGGVEYIGIHPFGEQGPFPGGDSRHGNLMFSALTFTSRRRVQKIVNIDTGRELLEDDPEFHEVVMSGGLVGS